MHKPLEMFRRSRLSAALGLVALLCACSMLQPRQPMPIGEVITLARGNVSPDQVISRVRNSKTTYALRGSDFAKLAQRGVPAPVLDHLQQSFVNEVDLLTRFWVLGESLGGCDWCYPQPIDLSNLDQGGNGMTGEAHLGRMEDFSRPQGLPTWVPSWPGNPFAHQITVDEIVNMVKSGTPTDEVVKQIRDSRFPQVIEDRGLDIKNIGTHYPVALKGSELASLATQGVPDAVLDALQEKFLAEYIEFARQRYESWGKGSRP
ncbi:MAG TPA: hypothetical protein VFB20_11930 [Burkholderiales bacterium]|nr:hypothetical protein [Burkholderiales bacterium]